MPDQFWQQLGRRLSCGLMRMIGAKSTRDDAGVVPPLKKTPSGMSLIIRMRVDSIQILAHTLHPLFLDPEVVDHLEPF